MSRFLDGGIDTVLVEYLQHLAQNPRYRITLAIGLDMGDQEVFANELPANISVCHLVQGRLLNRFRREKVRHRLPLYEKLFDEVLLTPVRRIMIRRSLQRLAAVHDVVIDFDCCFYAYLQPVRQLKIAFFHFSFRHVAVNDARRLRRFGKHLDVYDKIVLIAKGMQVEAEQLFPDKKDKFTVIYNPKDMALMQQRAAEPVSDERIQEAFVVAVERLTTPKDIPTLLKAFQLLRLRYHHAEKLFIIGKGEQETELRRLAEDLQIADAVEFLGFMANPMPWIKASRMLVHSSAFEGFGAVLVEGLMLEKTVVATDCPIGPREILDDGRAGLLVPVGDASALAEAMHQGLTDVALQARLLEGSRRQVQHFSFASVDRQLEVLFAMKTS